MTVVEVHRVTRGKGLRSRAAKQRKRDLSSELRALRLAKHVPYVRPEAGP